MFLSKDPFIIDWTKNLIFLPELVDQLPNIICLKIITMRNLGFQFYQVSTVYLSARRIRKSSLWTGVDCGDCRRTVALPSPPGRRAAGRLSKCSMHFCDPQIMSGIEANYQLQECVINLIRDNFVAAAAACLSGYWW